MKGTSMLLAFAVLALAVTGCTQVNDDTPGVDEREARGDTNVNVNVGDQPPTTVNNTTTVYQDRYIPIVIDDDPDTIVVREGDDAMTVVWESGERERNEDIARDFIESTSTYSSDGSDLTLAGAEKIPTNPPMIVYEFRYTSQGEGYGDRDEVVGEPVQHRVRVVIVNGDVVSAINDGIWNEITNRPVTQSGSRAQGEVCGDGNTCQTGLYCFRTSDTADGQGFCLQQA